MFKDSRHSANHHTTTGLQGRRKASQLKTLSCGPTVECWDAGMQRSEQWLGCKWVSTRLDQVAAFLETGLLLARLIRQGNCYPWHTWENMLTLKKSWDLLTVETKQRAPAATPP